MHTRRYRWAAGVLSAAYCAYFCVIVFLKYRSYSYSDFDLAVHTLSLQSLLSGSLYNSILGIPFLGNHMQPVLFLVAAVYAVFRHPLTLLFLQTAFLAAGVVPLYALSARLLDERWAFLISGAYLFYPAVGYINLFEFHPVALAVFFLLAAVYYYEKGAFRNYLICMFLAFFCKENIPLVFIMLGVMAFFEKKEKRWAFVTLVSSVLYLAAALTLMAAFNDNTVQYLLLYEHLGGAPVQIAATLFSRPQLLLGLLMRREVAAYGIDLFSPLIFLPVFASSRLLPALPSFLQHLLSNRPSDLMIVYHYTAVSIPFLFWALIRGIKRMTGFSRDRRFPGLLAGLFVCGVFLNSAAAGPFPGLAPSLLRSYRIDAQDRFKEQCVRRIPSGASVVATFEFLPHLTARTRLYSFHHHCKGTYTLSRKPYRLPEDVSYALIDFNDPLTFGGFCDRSAYRATRDFFLGRSWETVDHRDSIVLLRTADTPQFALCSRIAEESQSAGAEQASVTAAGALGLSGVQFVPAPSDSACLEFDLYWRCERATPRDIDLVFHIVDQEGGIVQQTFVPLCYRIFPSYRWKEGERYRQRIRLGVPPEYRRKQYDLRISFIDASSGRFLSIQGSDMEKSHRLRKGLDA